MVVPTLVDLARQLHCDIKGENWTLTSGFRARHGRVLLFDPTNGTSAAYNPLLEVRRGEWEVRDVQNVADVLVDPEGSLERRNHWEKTSHALPRKADYTLSLETVASQIRSCGFHLGRECAPSQVRHMSSAASR